jgi:hypothetical protein
VHRFHRVCVHTRHLGRGTGPVRGGEAEALLEKLRTRLTMESSAAAKPCVAEIAAEAHRVGRQRLATMLLEQVR